jgi:hypothetical protein
VICDSGYAPPTAARPRVRRFVRRPCHSETGRGHRARGGLQARPAACSCRRPSASPPTPRSSTSRPSRRSLRAALGPSCTKRNRLRAFHARWKRRPSPCYRWVNTRSSRRRGAGSRCSFCETTDGPSSRCRASSPCSCVPPARPPAPPPTTARPTTRRSRVATVTSRPSCWPATIPANPGTGGAAPCPAATPG